MDRLIDYFAVVGYDFDAESKDPALRGKVLFKVPEDDIKDLPFTPGIELFCQPGGWHLAAELKPPTFYVVILTDAEGKQQYCAVHSFFEPIKNSSPTSTLKHQRKFKSSIIRRVKSESDVIDGSTANGETGASEEILDEDMYKVEVGDSDEVTDSANAEKTLTKKNSYAPKCLVLLSRVHDFRILKNCLGLIYTVYIENLSQSIENIIAKLLLIKSPPPGSSVVRFSIGAADKQALQTPQSDLLPVTRSSVTVLLRQLGILNALNILTAALIDQKLLFYSCSYARLTEACNALTAIMFPFKYSYPYIPILPRHLLECTSSPTPFLFGVHSSFKNEVQDLLDVVTVDLDGGVISVPEGVIIPPIPEPFYTSAVEALTKVLCPDLVVADWAYPPEQVRPSEPERLDKEIRAIFLRLFSQLLMGYRACLQVCRIYPKPIIRFQKEQYLTMRGFQSSNGALSNQFVPKLLDSQAFSVFVQENGPPYRRIHIFDEVVAVIPDRIQNDINNVLLAVKHIKEIASDLYVNENPNHTTLPERIPKPTEGSFARSAQRRFPMLSVEAVGMFVEENKLIMERERLPRFLKQSKKRITEGTRLGVFSDRLVGPTTSSGRLEVLKSCLSFIFESKTLEIKKIFQAVIRALKGRGVRYALIEQLQPYTKNHSFLDNQQYVYISRLLNTALQDSSGQLDEYRLAADMVPITTRFCRKLSATVTQFMYTSVQDHPVWTSSGFWESAFFDDIQEEIQQLYKESVKNENRVFSKRRSQQGKRDSVISLRHLSNSSDEEIPIGTKEEIRLRRDNQLCMTIAAIQLKLWDDKTKEEQDELASAEESVVYSQAMLNAQKMVYMLVPLDASRVNRNKYLQSLPGEENSSNSYVTSNWTGSNDGSIGDESGFDESQDSAIDVSVFVSKFISRLVDRVCTEACITGEHTKALLERIPKMVRMQVESLIDVCRESKRIPPVTKPKLLHPQLLKGESLALEKPYRSFLVADGRGTATGGLVGGPTLLPAEGALFVTTYRVIFIGTPCDALASEQVVIRSFPVSTLFKIKPISVHDFPRFSEIRKNLQLGILLCSSTFQFLVLCLDEDGTVEDQECLQKELHDLRYPETIEGAFAISSSIYGTSTDANTNTVIRSRSSAAWDNKTLTNARAMTLFKQAKRKAGFEKASKPLYLPGPLSLAGGVTGTLSRSPPNDNMTLASTENDGGKLMDRFGEQDYSRMKMIGSKDSRFRVSVINQIYAICKTYPSSTVIPRDISDNEIRLLAHCHQNGRYPIVTWMHPSNNTLLVRASAIRNRMIGAMFKQNQSKVDPNAPSAAEEKFLVSIVKAVKVTNASSSESMGSLTSLDDEAHLSPTILSRSVAAISSATRVKSRKWSTFSKSNGRPFLDNADKLYVARSVSGNSSGTEPTSAMASSSQLAAFNKPMTKAQLYVFCGKEQIKNIKPDHTQGRISFVPLDRSEPKDIRLSFKALVKSVLPSDPNPTPNNPPSQQQGKETVSYLKNVQDSLWLEQVSLLLSNAGYFVNLMDTREGSVMLALDDGQDCVPQLSSLTQILLDPYYRTIEGFKVLMEKEWLSCGHRFGHRNRFNDIQSSGFTPVFLMFLDAVYQVHHQFPLSFEFNELYLEMAAYHCMSNRFNTFLLDSDYERLEAGILVEEDADGSRPLSETKSFWDYAIAAHKRSPVFYNPFFSPQLVLSKVLRPISELSALKIWPYYVREALGEGPPYDGLMGELTTGSSHNEQAAAETSEAWGGATGRRVVNRCYDNISEVQPDSIKILLDKIKCLQMELAQPTQTWSDSLKTALGSVPPHSVQPPTASLGTYNELLSLHQKSTDEFLQKQHLSTKSTRRSFRVSKSSNAQESLVESDHPEEKSDDEDSSSSVEDDHVQSSIPNNKEIYQGLLWKQGALMKGWKSRSFILDTIKHELRQYDDGSTSASKIIDLKDVESVNKMESISNVPKDASEKGGFEVKTLKRVYCFIAESEEAASEWVDHLQASLQ